MKGAVAAGAATGATVAAVTMPWDKIFANILGAGGVPPALFLLIVGGLVAALLFQLKRCQTSEEARRVELEAAAAERNTIQEKRIEEINRTVLALERTATALGANTLAIESRTATLNEAVQALSKMAQNQEATREYFKDAVQTLHANQKEILKLLPAAVK